MSVPNTSTFSLQDVVDEISPTTDDLQDCVDDAQSGGYDGTYYTSPATSLYEFRNYSHSTTWADRVEANANTTSYDFTSDVPSGFLCEGLYVNSAGTKAYMINQGDKKIYQWNMSTAHDVSTMSYAGVSSAITKKWTSSPLINGLYFNTAGTRVFSMSASSNSTAGYKMYSHTLSTAWDITSFSDTVTTSCQFTGLTGSPAYWQGGDFGFTDDGKKLIVPHNSGSSDAQKVRKYVLTTAWDLSSVSNLGGSSEILFGVGLPGTNLLAAIPLDPSDNTLTDWIGNRLEDRDATSAKYAFEEYSGYASTTDLSYYEAYHQTTVEIMSMANPNYLFTVENTNDTLRMYEIS